MTGRLVGFGSPAVLGVPEVVVLDHASPTDGRRSGFDELPQWDVGAGPRAAVGFHWNLEVKSVCLAMSQFGMSQFEGSR